MKLPLVLLLLTAAIATAQFPQPQPPRVPVRIPGSATNTDSRAALSENYSITLKINEKEGGDQELSLLVGSSEFNTTFEDSKGSTSSFTGTVTEEADGALFLRYSLAREIPFGNPQMGIQYKNVATSVGVRIRLGESQELFKSPVRTISLRVAVVGGGEKKAP